MLGGPNGCMLFVPTATFNGSADEARISKSGRIEMVEVDVPARVGHSGARHTPPNIRVQSAGFDRAFLWSVVTASW